MTIGDSLQSLAIQQPHKPAICYNGQTIDYATFSQKVRQYEQKLLSQFVTNQQRTIAILCGNEPAFLELCFAIVRLGWIVLPLDPKWTEKEQHDALKSAHPDLCIVSDEEKFNTAYLENYLLLKDLETTQPISDEEHIKVESTTIFYYGFTSGSSGLPKGFVRNHRSWEESFPDISSAFSYEPDDVVIAPGPLCYSLSLFSALHALHSGYTFILFDSFKADSLLDYIQKHQKTIIYIVPTMLYQIIEAHTEPIFSEVTFISAGAKLEDSIKQICKAAFPNARLFEYYGASELSIVAYQEITNHSTYHNIKPFPGVQLSIRNQTGEKCKANEIGQIYVNSNYIFTAYPNHHVETQNVLTTYGATVGDIGYLDDSGNLTVMGRHSNMIISGGLNIYPEEIEQTIKTIDAIKEVVVIGCDDMYWGQKVIAFIQWETDHQNCTNLIKTHCQKHLAKHKVPKSFITVTKFPYTNNGKVDRKLLQERLRDETHANTCYC